MIRAAWLLPFAACAASAQTVDAPAAFEVASVKLSAREQWRDRFHVAVGSLMRGGPGTGSPGQISFTSASLITLIASAYGVKTYQISGPAWFDAVSFDIVAKVPAGATKRQVDVMLRNLLAERFALRLHHEKRDLPVYTLTVGKNGPKMKLCEDPEAGGEMGPWNGGARLVAPNWTMQGLADFLSPRLDRPVLNRTGLTPRYDFTLYWLAENMEMPARPAADEAPEPAPNIFSAVQEQLGLKMQRSTSTVDMLVIDHAEKTPTEN
jgi:uncharacterized protein (TIGR03435 family)